MVLWVYLLRCSDGSLYVGSTKDLDLRIRRHNDGRASSYTSSRRPVMLVYSEKCSDLAAGRARERQIKRWTRAKKEALIAGDLQLLKKL